MLYPVVMYGCELDYKESREPKNWCFWTVVLEKTLESPLESKEIKPVHLKGNQSCLFFGRTDAEAPILRPPDAKNQLTGKDLDAGKDWRQEEKGTTEDEMVGWHHRLNGHEFEQSLGDSEDREAWHAVHGVAKSRTGLSDWTATTEVKGGGVVDQINLFRLSAPGGEGLVLQRPSQILVTLNPQLLDGRLGELERWGGKTFQVEIEWWF